jgi:hypothetical protein
VTLSLVFKRNIDSLLFAATGFIIILLFTKHSGIGVEPDSVVYFSAAENLHATGALTDFMHKPVVVFPAFYPFFLSGISVLTGLRPLIFAPILNALLFAVIIYLSAWIMDRFLFRSLWYKWAILCCIVLSPCLLEVYSMMWSETIFILLIFLFIIALHNYFQSYSRKVLIAVAVIASLASITRYAGIVIIAAGGILLVLDMKMPLRRKITDLFLYVVVSPLLLIINLVRNYFVGPTLTGMRETSITSLRTNLHHVGSVFYDWLPFLRGHYSEAGWMAVFIFVSLTWMCLKQFSRNKRVATYEAIAGSFALVYLVFIVTIASISRFETLNSRFLAPAFIPLVWGCTCWITKLHVCIPGSGKKWIAVLGAIVFLSFQYGQLSADAETWEGVKDAGIPGYTEDSWRYSETIQFIQKDSLPFKQGYTVYSNANDAVYFFTGRDGKFLPRKDRELDVQEFLQCSQCYVVLFEIEETPDNYHIDLVTRVKKMKLLKQFSDGAIYGSDQD